MYLFKILQKDKNFEVNDVAASSIAYADNKRAILVCDRDNLDVPLGFLVHQWKGSPASRGSVMRFCNDRCYPSQESLGSLARLLIAGCVAYADLEECLIYAVRSVAEGGLGYPFVSLRRLPFEAGAPPIVH